ncbi:urease accessory protein UreD [Anaeromyxobacter paludicola]|uniref:urease accessory protein UreD n=1 Tax=Anaeromyxobacter paludicola TaxID=2918171 RepID=UPI0020BDF451|nr:urease accessory protein UreD [Anaeromyxobacter paludicola]
MTHSDVIAFDNPAPSTPSVRALPAPAAAACLGAEHPEAVAAMVGAGTGRIEAGLSDGATALLDAHAAAPLHLLVPRRRGAAVWAFTSSLGGGLVAGDRVRLSVEVGPGATLFLGTQSVAKVYRSPGPTAEQVLAAEAGDGALLASLPDPLCCFAGARLRQRQSFRLAPGASLVALDALASGRAARGERWAFSRVESRLEVWRGGALAIADALLLEDLPGAPLAARMGRLDAVASAVALGPRAARAAAALVAAARAADPADGLLGSVAEVPGGVVARFGAEDRGRLAALLARCLSPLGAELGGDPLQRKW